MQYHVFSGCNKENTQTYHFCTCYHIPCWVGIAARSPGSDILVSILRLAGCRYLSPAHLNWPAGEPPPSSRQKGRYSDWLDHLLLTGRHTANLGMSIRWEDKPRIVLHRSTHNTGQCCQLYFPPLCLEHDWFSCLCVLSTPKRTITSRNCVSGFFHDPSWVIYLPSVLGHLHPTS